MATAEWRERLRKEWGALSLEKKVDFINKAISVRSPERLARGTFEGIPAATQDELGYYLVRHPDAWPGN